MSKWTEPSPLDDGGDPCQPSSTEHFGVRYKIIPVNVKNTALAAYVKRF